MQKVWARSGLRSGVAPLALALALSACAGGGSGGGGTPPPDPPSPPGPPAPPPGPPSPPTDPAVYRTFEYNNSWVLEAVHAAEAYALGYSGDGVVIGVVDFNFHLSSSEVNYHSASRGPDAQAIAWYEAIFGDEVDTDPHGHAVAAAAAARKNGTGIHGVAFNAEILAVDYFSRANETTEVHSGITYRLSDPWTYLTSRGVRIINVSFGYDDGDSVPIPPHVSTIYDVISPAQGVANGALVVSSAGNKGGASPTKSNRDIVELIEDNNLDDGPGAFIIVGSVSKVGSDYLISSFSNRAGSYGAYFMVAPGDDVVLPYDVPACAPSGYCYLSGTSFASPMVAGAAALVLQRWPSLTAKEIAEILFESATDLGAPGNDVVYGHGMLNAYAALQPIGTTTFAMAGSAAFDLEASALSLGAAFGDAPALRSALGHVAILDSFKRDFAMDFSGSVVHAPGPSLRGLLQQRQRWHGAGYGIGTSGGIAVQLDTGRDLSAFRSNGLEERDVWRGAVTLRGYWQGVSWTGGTGLGLDTALDDGTQTRALPLTRAFSPMFSEQEGHFLTGAVPLDEELSLSFGAVRRNGAGLSVDQNASLHDGTEFSATALRFHYAGETLSANLEWGAASEDGTILGLNGHGGLGFAQGGMTGWTSLGGEWRVMPRWTLRGMATIAATDPRISNGGLAASFDTVLATAASFGVSRESVFFDDDALSFVVHQPLRVEAASLTFASGALFDADSGSISNGPRTISLAPSGREIAFEAGYAFEAGRWSAEASVAYRFDAGHIAGRQDGSAMLWVARNF